LEIWLVVLKLLGLRQGAQSFMTAAGGPMGLATKVAPAVAGACSLLKNLTKVVKSRKNTSDLIRLILIEQMLILNLNIVLVPLGSQLQSNATLRQSLRDLVSTKLARNRGQVSMARQLQNNMLCIQSQKIVL
jgi:hypothetical protein